MTTILIVRPRFDPATSFLFEWTNDVAEEVSLPRYKKYNVVELAQQETKALDIIAALDANRGPGAMYMHFDHGSYSTLIGQNREVAVDTNNPEALRGYMVFAFACESARVLGPAAIKAGAVCYLGYKESFGFVITKLKDFKILALTPAVLLLQGATFQDVYEHTKELLGKLMEKFYKEYEDTNDISAYLAAVWAYKDREAWTLLGNTQAKLV